LSTNTYVALDKVTVGTATPSVTFTGINQGYTDLVLVVSGQLTGGGGASAIKLQFNADTGTNYSGTILSGDGSSATSFRDTSQSSMSAGIATDASGQVATNLIQIMNYANSTTYKTVLARYGIAGDRVRAAVGLWRATPAAITSITIINNGGTNFSVGTTFSLYGIAATGAGAKATGGTIYSDDLYYYHVFGSTGTFTPLSSLSADVLVVAGGGGGGATNGAGGGAGGVFYATAQSLTATGYTCTVGGGGTGGTAASDSFGTSGTNSTFASLTAAVGGGYGAKNANAANGGSGGGGSNTYTAGTSTQTSTGGTGYGFGGGAGASGASAGGGGAGAAGSASGANQSGGAGGVGTTAFSSWVTATGIGQLVSSTGYIAGGGGGGADSRTASSTVGAGGFGGGGTGSGGAVGGVAGNGVAGTANTGGGGGGGGWTTGSVSGGAGGSGVVIVRYLKA
jgi:hypothetical protein